MLLPRSGASRAAALCAPRASFFGQRTHASTHARTHAKNKSSGASVQQVQLQFLNTEQTARLRPLRSSNAMNAHEEGAQAERERESTHLGLPAGRFEPAQPQPGLDARTWRPRHLTRTGPHERMTRARSVLEQGASIGWGTTTRPIADHGSSKLAVGCRLTFDCSDREGRFCNVISCKLISRKGP